MKEEYIQNFIHAGRLAKEVRAYGKALIIRGASYNDVISKINQKIHALGAIPAFPPQMALNHVAAHFLPWPGEDILFSDELIKLDIGVCYQGAIGDCAVTVDLSGDHQSIIDAAEAALLAAEQCIKVGRSFREIGRIIDRTISSYGLESVKNLCGHGLGHYQVHMPPSIPSYDDRSKGEVVPGMTFAIEPFATNGKGRVYLDGNPTIFSFLTDCPSLSEFVSSLLKKIKTFNDLPFAIHDLIGTDFPLIAVEVGLTELLKAGAIAGYAPLIEEAHGMVAQAENSVLIDNRGRVIITTR
ncbi:MAG: M24 family metallopeptidase [Chlamydiales bacterium]